MAAAALGIFVGQAILYGPSLLGKKILLPLDLLAMPGVYLPLVEPYKNIEPHNVTQSDLILGIEPARQAFSSELRAGRAPLWSPFIFAGTPAFRMGLSPAWIPSYLILSPVVLAWTQLLVALIAGLGMYYYCRRILELGPWPSVIAAWCYPLTGAYVLWVGQWIPAVMCGLPWSLAAVDRAVRSPRGWGGPALGLVTALLLLGGAMDIAGQVLLVSGFYALWCLWDEYGRRAFSLKGLRAVGVLALAWVIGFALSSWLLVPGAEYAASGSRMILRSAGSEERPPVGLKALPQIVLPDMYGSAQRGSYRIGALTLAESSAMAYAGSVSCLVLAPLSWFSRKRRSVAAILVFLALFSLSWTLNVPFIVALLRLPVLNMMSHNRLAFVTAFVLIALAAVGLEVLSRGEVRRQAWFAAPALLLSVLCGWCVYRSIHLPEAIAVDLPAAVEKAPMGYINEPGEVLEIQRNFRKAYAFNALFCGADAAFWLFLILGSGTGAWLAPALAALLCVQLIHFGYGIAAQTDPSLYYPKLPILERLAAAPPGRIIGFNCLPANLAQTAWLQDVRGYDGVDPLEMVQLLKTARNLPAQEMPYAATQYMSPVLYRDPQTGSLRIPPVLDMLGVRYVIFRGTPPPDIRASFVDTDYWVWTNERAMPRVYVPRRVEVIPDPQARVDAMNRPDFDPGDIAYVEQPIDVPQGAAGKAEVLKDAYHHLTLRAEMQTKGLVVLADRWDTGWRAYINDVEVPILRVNHAVRGVLAEPGVSIIRFVYLPSGFYVGLAVTGAGGICLLVWAGIIVYKRRRTLKAAN